MTWSPATYLAFADERTRPAGELLARVADEAPARVIDLGCGPGNSTALLRARWPGAKIEGLDSSPDMLAQAARSGVAAPGGAAGIRAFMPDQHREFFPLLPYLFVATTDEDGWPVATLLTGEPGFISSPDPTTLVVGATPREGEPGHDLFRAGRPFGALGLDFSTRRRNRANGVIEAADADGLRLKVLQSLDTLGAGFQVASHDLDIRGAGNLLGEEQSGHIKEVGFELYQQMLEEAVLSLKAGITAPVADRWSPQITIGTPVLIPDDYVADLSVRLALYRRLADLEDEREMESFAAELVDRFGPLPKEVEHLLQVVAIKALCRRANVEKIDAGPKGAVLSFRDNNFANPVGLLQFIQAQGPGARIRNDKSGQKLVLLGDWETPVQRLKGTTALLRQLAGIAEKKAA